MIPPRKTFMERFIDALTIVAGILFVLGFTGSVILFIYYLQTR